jgi:hypothetical protein
MPARVTLTFFQLLYLLGGEGRPVALQLALQPQAHLRVLVGGGVVLRVAVRRRLVDAVAPEIEEAS